MAAPPPRPTIPRLAELDLRLETPRLLLRPLELADVDDLWPIVSEPTFPAQLSWAAHRDPSETRAFVEQAHCDLADGVAVRWAIVHGGKAVGAIGLHDICWQVRALRVDRADLGYWLAPAVAGQGLMTEAVQAVVKFGFDVIGLHKITAHCFAENAASRRVIEKAAFRWVGRTEDEAWRDGAWHAGLVYELTAPEWPDVHTTMRVQRPKL